MQTFPKYYLRISGDNNEAKTPFNEWRKQSRRGRNIPETCLPSPPPPPPHQNQQNVENQEEVPQQPTNPNIL